MSCCVALHAAHGGLARYARNNVYIYYFFQTLAWGVYTELYTYWCSDVIENGASAAGTAIGTSSNTTALDPSDGYARGGFHPPPHLYNAITSSL